MLKSSQLDTRGSPCMCMPTSEAVLMRGDHNNTTECIVQSQTTCDREVVSRDQAQQRSVVDASMSLREGGGVGLGGREGAYCLQQGQQGSMRTQYTASCSVQCKCEGRSSA